jgi:CSLREA domain-containing protein
MLASPGGAVFSQGGDGQNENTVQNVIIVNTEADEADGTCGDGDCSLRDAIAVAGGGDTIRFDENTGNIDLDSILGELVIDKSLTIEGRSAAGIVDISGQNATRIIHVASGVTVTLSGLYLKNGRHSPVGAPAQGGAIYNEGTLLLDDMGFWTNHADGYSDLAVAQIGMGGAIYNLGTLSIQDSTFNGNQATGGSGMFGSAPSFGGAIYNLGTLSIQDTTFTGNQATGRSGIFGGGSGMGGAVYNTDGSILNIGNSLFETNFASGGDGAIFGGAGNGGAVFFADTGSMDITSSTFSGNTAQGGGSGDIDSVDGYGGALYIGLASVSLNYLTIANNNALGGATSAGGGIYSTASLSGDGPNLLGSIVANNTAANGPDIFQWVQSQDYNLIGDIGGATLENLVEHNIYFQDPLLGSLADNGGPTKTHALDPDSPAVDNVGPADCPATDARGVARPQDGDNDGLFFCDIGAFELEPSVFWIYLPSIRK